MLVATVVYEHNQVTNEEERSDNIPWSLPYQEGDFAENGLASLACAPLPDDA